MQKARQPSYRKFKNPAVVGGIAYEDAGGIETQDLEPTDQEGICGLKRRTFWIVITFAVILVVGAVVGGAVAGILTKKRSNATTPIDQMSTPAPTTPPVQPPPASAPSPPPTATNSLGLPYPTSGITGLAANSCNSSGGQNYTIGGQTFIPFCKFDFTGGSPTYDNTGPVIDVFRQIAYTFEECMGFCVSFNKDINSNDGRCHAITYNANLTFSVSTQRGNCFLKNARGVSTTSESYVASAVLAP
ncbi:hypothetical protein ABW20_dc0100016 [Dactylellina cionopaga]|nr:hypothetical protein ABW20_dc0100016 [Dactylellina cionopaga]